jgi:Peptidase A4 family
VGIDGIDGSMDVLQAGVDSDVMNTGFGPERRLRPWWEWLPGGSHWITNLPVAQGDVLNCVICVSEGTSASIFFYNVTSRLGTSFAATVPPDWQPLAGNCAEWIVERIPVDSSPPELARYGEVYFDDSQAGTASHALIQAGTGNTIDMVDVTGTISAGIIETPTLIQVKYTGS